MFIKNQKTRVSLEGLQFPSFEHRRGVGRPSRNRRELQKSDCCEMLFVYTGAEKERKFRRRAAKKVQFCQIQIIHYRRSKSVAAPLVRFSVGRSLDRRCSHTHHLLTHQSHSFLSDSVWRTPDAAYQFITDMLFFVSRAPLTLQVLAGDKKHVSALDGRSANSRRTRPRRQDQTRSD
ncbi:hypothetical protein L596_004519 [Steinernema carpocapsae]|uniref:Uncharacterized protein n=1 Tax=Steinernema carpocapsae TaxID=34508 RepID=A0A4V6I851_STECR|nr:hypothetical protein L596_004519 [Steinernema carpocapsae]